MGDTIGLADDVGAAPTDWSDVLPYEASEVPFDDGTVQAQGDDEGDDGGDDDGQGCHAGGGGDGDGGGHGDGSGGHHDGGNDDGDDADDQIRDGNGGRQDVGDPLSWSQSVTAAPAPAIGYDRPAHAADVNTFHPHEAAPPGHAGEVGNLLDWAFDPRGPIGGAAGGDVAQGIWGLLDRAGNFLRR